MFLQSCFSPWTLVSVIRACKVSEDIFVDDCFLQRHIHILPCGCEVIAAINFHKRLDLYFLAFFFPMAAVTLQGLLSIPDAKVWLRCHCQCFSWWLFCVLSSVKRKPAPPSWVSQTCHSPHQRCSRKEINMTPLNNHCDKE